MSWPTQREEDLFSEEGVGESIMRIYSVLRVMGGPDRKLWAIGSQMRRATSAHGDGIHASVADISVVHLRDVVRHVGVTHIFDGRFVPHSGDLSVKHSLYVCDRRSYELWMNEQGY